MNLPIQSTRSLYPVYKVKLHKLELYVYNPKLSSYQINLYNNAYLTDDYFWQEKASCKFKIVKSLAVSSVESTEQNVVLFYWKIFMRVERRLEFEPFFAKIHIQLDPAGKTGRKISYSGKEENNKKTNTKNIFFFNFL